VITVAVRWYLRYGLSYRDVEELLAERGIDVDHVTVYRWVQRFTPLFADGVSAATVRGWLRRLRSAAEAMRRDAMYQLGFVGGLADPPLPGPAASPLGDALNAVAACAHAANHPVRPVPGRPVAAAGPVRPGPPSRARPRRLIFPASPGTGMPAARPRRSP
jgi:hypothetical protein